MDKIIHAVESIRAKIDGLRRRNLKETPTRAIVIDPLLEALGWDVRDLDEVEQEFTTIDGKSVDYALKLNGKPILFVEAKALDDTLSDVKAVTQVISYAANGGVTWCILTNGLIWKIYRSIEQCPAPDKLMYEVTIDPRDPEETPVAQIAQQLNRFSREEMAKGTLDVLGEKTFTDGKVRKVLGELMLDPPSGLINLVRKQLDDESLSKQQVKLSLIRIWRDFGVGAGSGIIPDRPLPVDRKTDPNPSNIQTTQRINKPRKISNTQREYEESIHTQGKPQETLELFRSIERFCIALNPDAVNKHVFSKCIAYKFVKNSFCSVHILKNGLRIWLNLQYPRLENPPSFARDVSNVGHWGSGDVELRVTDLDQVNTAKTLIRQSFESVSQRYASP